VQHAFVVVDVVVEAGAVASLTGSVDVAATVMLSGGATVVVAGFVVGAGVVVGATVVVAGFVVGAGVVVGATVVVAGFVVG